MSDHASTRYADGAWHGRASIVENVQLARDTWRVRIASPEIARQILPGQFVMLRLPGANDPLLGRPLALYETVLDAKGQPVAIDVVYLVVGKFTGRLTKLGAGDSLEVWGPLGNGFSPKPTEHLLMVAGGIGQTPFAALGRESLGGRQYGTPPRVATPAKRVTLCYGARSAEYLAGVEDFREIGIDVRTSTDDGSAGHHGLVTDLVRHVLDEKSQGVRIVCCGPERMMEAVAHLAKERGVPCDVSLETPMACGIGICFSCVARVKQPDGSWDYRRTCVEGPVFDAATLEW